jgi:NAD(P)-dependent dehydrogenase (short-subunit alcohol dehydrogenase family)
MVFQQGLLSGKVALVTGGGSGIGAGIAKALKEAGAELALLGRKIDKLEAVALELGGALCLPCDVRNYEAVEAAIKQIQEKHGRLDVLVNGAAGNFLAPAISMSANAFKTVIDIDLCGSFNVSKAAFPLLSENKGCIVNITALQAEYAMPFQAHAGAAKAGIEKLTRDLALEWGRAGVRVNAICPGAVAGTEGMTRLAPGEFTEALIKRIPLQRFAEVQEIAESVVFLCSPGAKYITGTSLIVDGGLALVGLYFEP